MLYEIGTCTYEPVEFLLRMKVSEKVDLFFNRSGFFDTFMVAGVGGHYWFVEF